jgi:hypothetical protein
MTKTILEKTRSEAQNLHKKISANIAKAEQASWADVRAVQDDVNALGTKMKTLADDQADAAKNGIKSAIAKLEAAGKLVENKAVSAKDSVKHANDALLDSAQKAAKSLSTAVAAMRTKAAHAIEPKKVTS